MLKCEYQNCEREGGRRAVRTFTAWPYPKLRATLCDDHWKAVPLVMQSWLIREVIKLRRGKLSVSGQ
jgi:hypothetical protein